jgi:glycosyltransferase involved in cell wall biosynthesis
MADIGLLTSSPGTPPERYSPKLSVILSFRNEEEVLPELIRRLRAVLMTEEAKGHLRRHELIFVNDMSTDNSLLILQEASREQEDIRVITMSRTFGVSPCVLAGMKYASGDLIVYMDADLQDPPEVIPDLLRVWRESSDIDIVHTVRKSRAGESRIKLWITRIGYQILHSTASINLPIEAGDFKLLTRRAVSQLIRFEEKSPFIRGLVQWIGFNQATVYYHREPRFAGETKYPIFSLRVIRNFFASALISFSEVPLQLASFIGILSSLSAFVVLLHILIEKVRGNNLPGWTAIMVALLFLSGLQLLSVGVLGLYIGSVFSEVKNRPNYIIKDLFGFPPGSVSEDILTTTRSD